jgi:7-keto-8-aminopelargonate synthetase-like enzyme
MARMKEPEELRQVNPTTVLFRGRRLTFFAGCDYYRVSSHPAVARALGAGLRKFGLSVAASRVTTGNHALYTRVEQALAKFFDAEQATLVSTGYLADLVAAEALAGRFSHALLDSAAHPALRHASLILGCPVLTFASRQTADLARTLARCGREARPIVLTEGMFARNGSVAPLKEYLRSLPRDGMLLVDDAHGAGVLGDFGQGSLEYCGVNRTRIIQTVTLSKAFGVFGGAVLGNAPLREKIISRSAMFIGSTPPPLPLMSSMLESLRICERGTAMRRRLHKNADRLKTTLRERGLEIGPHPGPIVALAPSGRGAQGRVANALLAARIYPSLIQYPGAPKGGYFRFVISSEHSTEEIDRLAETLAAIGPSVFTSL